MSKLTTEERFWSRVHIPDDESLCWIWLGGKGPLGHGKFYTKDKLIGNSSHRYSWYLHNGNIPTGIFVLHKCDNGSCVNPNHLFLGTQKDNCQDAVSKGRNHIYSVLDENDVLCIRALFHWSGFDAKSIATEFKCDKSNIHLIVSGKTWKSVRVNF